MTAHKGDGSISPPLLWIIHGPGRRKSRGSPPHPINPYGGSKFSLERRLGDLDKLHELPWIALRYFNAAGADPEEKTSEAHDPEPLIPLVIRAACSGEPPYNLSIFGAHYDTSDGDCVRDYVHVCDIADAHVRTLEHLLPGGSLDTLGKKFFWFAFPKESNHLSLKMQPGTVQFS